MVGGREMPERLRHPASEQDRPAGERPPPPPPHALLVLQAAAGNRAVARALLARDGVAFGPVQAGPVLPAPHQIDPSILAGLDKRRAEIEAAVRAWVRRHQEEIQGHVVGGWSLPEVVDHIRSNVEEAMELSPETVGKIARATLDPFGIPEHRLQNRERELAAELRNAMSKLPTELKIGGKGAWAKVSIMGFEAAAKAGGAELTAEAGPGSASVGVKKGGAEAKAEASWEDKSIGLDTKVGPIGLGGKIEMGKRDGPAKWEVHIGVPQAGALGPLLPSTQKAVQEAGDSVSGIIRHLRQGGRRDDPIVSEHLDRIKKGMQPLGKMAQDNAVSFGISVTGEGPDVRVEAGLTWRF
jgi:hypothetical protein